MPELKIDHPYTTHDDFNNADPTITQDTCRTQLMTLFLFSVRSRKSEDSTWTVLGSYYFSLSHALVMLIKSPFTKQYYT